MTQLTLEEIIPSNTESLSLEKNEADELNGNHLNENVVIQSESEVAKAQDEEMETDTNNITVANTSTYETSEICDPSQTEQEQTTEVDHTSEQEQTSEDDRTSEQEQTSEQDRQSSAEQEQDSEQEAAVTPKKPRGRPKGQTVKAVKEPSITIAYLAKGIVSKELVRVIDFKNVINGHWEFKNGKKNNDLLSAIRTAKIVDGEDVSYDLNILKDNLKSILAKVK
jgi:cobalamin-dependent methionine synthase I